MSTAAKPTKPTTDRRHTESPDTIEFFFPKDKIMPTLIGVQLIQKRDDLSGPFARKCGRQGRVLRASLEALQKESDDLTDAHKEKYPEGHPKAGQATPVYASDEHGKPVFKKDKDNNDTEERAEIPGRYNIKDPLQYKKDFDALMKEVIVIRCSPFLTKDPAGNDTAFVPELARFKGVNGAAIDACMNLEETSELTHRPAGFETPVAEEAAPAPEAVTAEPEKNKDEVTAP